MNKISIIVPAYNVDKYLGRCLDSIRNQTYRNWECIIVNDGSTDETLQIANEYLAMDERFLVFSQKNGGLSAARNQGLQLGTGSYITFVDSDDAIHPQFLELLYREFEKNQIDMAICNFERFSKELPSTERTGGSRILTGEEGLKAVVCDRVRFMITSWGKLYRRELFQEIRFPVGKLHEDEFTTYLVMGLSKNIAVLDQKLYYYFQRSESIMGQYKRQRLEIMLAFSASVEYVKERFPALYEEAFQTYLFNLAIGYYRAYGLGQCTEICQAVRTEFCNQYLSWKRKRLGVKEIAILIFRYMPHVYCLIAGIYIRMNLDE